MISINFLAQEQSPDTTLGWKYPTIINLSLSQSSYSNWSAGGENSNAINGFVLLNANYKSTMAMWDNSLTLAYGMMKQGDTELRKTDDKLELTSKYGYKAKNNWYYSGLMQFKTQFSNGYKYDDVAGTKNKLSAFMSPAYLDLAIGMNYTPSPVFNLFIGPISGKSTFVMDEELSNAGAFGVDSSKNVRNEFGGSIKISLNKDILKNVNLSSKLQLFSNYLENPENIDVDWQMFVNLKVNKWLSASINLQLIYDDDIKIIEDNVEKGAEIQFKEVFGIGLNFKF
jgi:hypothetical protein